jgi:hypothetical protein
MKKQTLFILLQIICLCSFTQAQNLEGKWKGVLIIGTGSTGFYERSFEFSIQLKQAGRAVWGIYVRGSDTTVKNGDCMGRLTAGLADKKDSAFTIFNDGTESGNLGFDVCNLFYSMQAEYSKNEQGEYLSGKWFIMAVIKEDLSLPAGKFVLEKVSSEPDINVDIYFPNLARLKRKFNDE